MNITKGIAALTLAALAISTQGVYAGSINYIVSADTPTTLRLTVNHPDSTFGSKTFTLAPPITNWGVNGSIKDNNAGLFSLGIDTVTITGLTVQHLVNPRPGGPVFAVPNVTAAGAPNNVGSITSPLITYSSSAAHGAATDYVEVTGTFKWHSTNLGGADIDAYNFVVLGDHVANAVAPVALRSSLSVANESSQVSSSAFGSLAGFFHPDTSQLNLEIGLVGLQKSDITGIQITSNSPGFETLNLGTSTLVDGLNGVAFGGDVLMPLADLGAIEAGNTFVNILTHNNPTGEIGGTLSTLQISPVPEPSSFILFASGIAGLAWWRRKKIAA